MKVPVLLVLGVLMVLLSPAKADVRPTLAGRWSASALRSTWTGQWGSACGPRPGSDSEPGGTATIKQQAGELLFSGPGRAYSTRQCWAQYPGLRQTSHTASARAWRNVCKTGPNDARQATIVTTISATDNTITFDETGQYRFVSQGQTCTAKVRSSRSFKLIQRAGEAAPTRAGASASPTQASKPRAQTAKPAPTTSRCAEVGPASRLEVRPARKLMRPGEQFIFRASVSDAVGCPMPTAVAWRVANPEAPVRLAGQGRVNVAEDAPETEVELIASVGKRSVAVMIEVASNERYDALLRQRGLNEAGESDDAAVAVIASGAIGARSIVSGDRGAGRRTRFALMVGVAALLLGLVGLVLVRRGRRSASTAAAMVAGEPTQRSPSYAPSKSAGMVCPTCREEYPAGAQFCAVDGNRLLSVEGGEARVPTGGVCPVCGQGFDPGVALCPQHNEELVPPAVYQATMASTGPVGRKICPICGAQYPSDGRFCGTDGAALVPVN